MDQLITDITETLSNPTDGFVEKMKSLLMDYYESGNQDWMDYKFSNPHSYSRNLIYISELFEAVLLVWGKDQCSPIHNHNHSNCWFGVMEGYMSETQYSYTLRDNVAELQELETQSFSGGDVAVVLGDDILHKVFGHGATLHIYSPPIYKCNIYCPCTGSIDVRRPGFYTIYKKLLDADVMIYKKVYDSLEAKEKKSLEEKCASRCVVNAGTSQPRQKKGPSFLQLVDDAQEFSKTNTDYL